MPETTAKPRKKATKAVKPAETGGSISAAQKYAQAPQKPQKGRPTKFDTDIASQICVRLANGEALRQICLQEGMPAQSTVYLWLTRHPEFSEMYARAREEQADTLADEIQAIADETPDLNPIYGKNGELIRIELHSAYIQWQKNRIDARKWVASKLKPRKYGDRVAVEGTEDGAPIKTEDTGSSRLFELIKNMEMAKRAG